MPQLLENIVAQIACTRNQSDPQYIYIKRIMMECNDMNELKEIILTYKPDFDFTFFKEMLMDLRKRYLTTGEKEKPLTSFHHRVEQIKHEAALDYNHYNEKHIKPDITARFLVITQSPSSIFSCKPYNQAGDNCIMKTEDEKND